MRRCFLIFILLFLSACNQYTLVKSEQLDINGISITPSGLWNDVPQAWAATGKPMWTADGVTLNSVMFFPAIESGKPLIKPTGDENYPLYDNSMLANEVVELVESSISKLYKGTIISSGELTPKQFGSDTGFQFSFEFSGGDDVPRTLLANAIVKEEKLYLVLYQATKLYYYDKYFNQIQRMFDSIRV